MDKRALLNLLDNVNEDGKETKEKGDRILIIDGMNLFLRNFAILNFINDKGVHIGGMGGFLRSLGSLINNTHPSQVYVVFDGVGSSTNRKNLIPEYKSNRNQTRLTNFNSFNDIEEEQDSKVNQIEALIYYLKCLPIHVISLDKVEADDTISYLSATLASRSKDNKVVIVSADNDFLQLINEQITIYRPVQKEYLTSEYVKEKFGVYPHNFIIYKTLMGDASDKVKGVKGLGQKKFEKYFPEVTEKAPVTLDDIIELSEDKYDQHVLYSRVVFQKNDLKKGFKVMNLNNPMLDDKEKDYILDVMDSQPPKLDIAQFKTMYVDDGLGNLIKNVNYWLHSTFDQIDRYNRSRTK